MRFIYYSLFALACQYISYYETLLEDRFILRKRLTLFCVMVLCFIDIKDTGEADNV